MEVCENTDLLLARLTYDRLFTNNWSDDRQSRVTIQQLSVYRNRMKPIHIASLTIGAVIVVSLLIGSIFPGQSRRDGASGIPLANPDNVYNPERAGEPLPSGYRPLLYRDAIAPIYDPEFVPVTEVNWKPSDLVIGVSIAGQAKAYLVNHLSRREMVIDRLAGIPILVTW